MSKSMSFMVKFVLLVLCVISYTSLAFADHNSSASLEPEWSPAGQNVDYTVTFCKISGDNVTEVRIYKNYDGSIYYTDFECDEKPGWELLYIGSYPACFYVANSSSPDYDPLDEDGECENFTFSATTPGQEYCNLVWRFETRDVKNEWKYLYDNTSVDDTPPNITKAIGEPNYGNCPPGENEVCWVTTSTEINISVIDQGECGISGLDYCDISWTVDETFGKRMHNPLNGNTSWNYTLTFKEESVHVLNITCKDIAGNIITDIEVFKVDDTAPETNKTYGEPHFSNGTSEWITNSTPITLTAMDGGKICAIGTDKIYYRVKLVSDDSCWDPSTYCSPEYNPDDPNWTEYTAPFTIDEESCHRIEYYSVDKLGNRELVKAQCVFVDTTPPNGTKTIGEPKISCDQINNSDCWWVRDHVTEINLTCEDQEPHPVNNEEVCFRISFDGEIPWLTDQYCQDVNGSMEGDWCCVKSPVTIIFKEDSLHDLEYYCRDALGNKNEPDLEYFKVDSQPPVITKTIIGPQVGDCPPEENGKCWIKDWTCESNGTTIHIDAYDNETYGCAVDQITCDWWYYVDGNYTPGETNVTPPFDIKFYDETEHELHVKCCDELGNCYEDIETFYVDSSGPNVTKEFIGPWYRNQSGVEWIDTVTNISLTAHDNPEGECAVGNSTNSTIYWRDYYFPDESDWHYCLESCAGWQTQYPQNPLDPTGEGWNKYEEPFNDLNESCHVLEYYAVDALGNVGHIGVNCFFVDKTPPTASATVGDPKIGCEEGEGCDYWVRDRETEIKLNCVNQGDHPSPLDKIQWRIWDDITGNWTEWKESQAGVEGYDVTIIFTEDSVHKIQYKCNDTVGKETDVKEKVFRVDSTPPNITKTMLGIEGKDWNGSCPPKNPGDICYVRGGSGISVSVYDPDPTGKGCAVDNVSCSYEVWWNNTLVDNGTFTNSTEIKFNEDSAHDVVIYCEDALGNSIEDNETFLVDSTPPVTTKSYGQPTYVDGDYRWITSQTPINLTATDNKVGVNKTYYRVTLVGNVTCPENCDYTGSGNFTEYLEPFTIDQDSCHLIEYYSVDKLGNEEQVKKQCVMVDNTPPIGTKTIGEPSKVCENQSDCDYWVSQNTPINLTCTDQQPHPVDNEKVCYKVKVDDNDNTTDYCFYFRGTLNQEGYCCINSNTTTIYFLEDSNHTLEFYCEDALGNRNEVDVEKFRVDGTPPLTIKTYGEPYHSQYTHECVSDLENPGFETGDLTGWTIEAENDSVAVVSTDSYTAPYEGNYMVRLGDDNGGINHNQPMGPNTISQIFTVTHPILSFAYNIFTYDYEGYNHFGYKVIRVNDSQVIYQYDQDMWGEYEGLKSTGWRIVRLNLSDYVGQQLKLIISSGGTNDTLYSTWTYVDFGCEKTEWITSSTPITLTAEDGGDCAVDNVTTYYRNLWLPGHDEVCYEYCYPEYYVQYVENYTQIPFEEYTGPFYKSEESCHVIEYYSVDELGNIEPLKWQCVFVDNTPPTLWKEHSPGMIEDNDTILGEFHWMTKDMKIDLYCRDDGAHPVDHVKLWYRVWDDVSQNWSEWIDPNGVEAHKTITFGNDSVHKIQYYCEDVLGNSNGTQDNPHEQIYKVDSTPPNTTKTYLGPHYVDENGSEYIDTATTIELTAEDGGEICAIGVNKTYYRVTQIYDVYYFNYSACEYAVGNGSFTEYLEPFSIANESCHLIEYYSVDSLGNTETTKRQCVFVDKTPPIIEKDYIGPYFAENGLEWINSNTEIFINVIDPGPHPSGLANVSYRVTLVNDEYCWNQTLCQEIDGSGDWQYLEFDKSSPKLYQAIGNINEESCHLIEIKAKDNVDKSSYHKQCVFVDNSAPEPNKTVGKPKTEWDGKDAYYYDIADKCWSEDPEKYIECWKVTLFTPITLDCIDQEPHPVDHEETCFKVEVDGDDKTEYYCNLTGGIYNKYGDGFCCGMNAPYQFYFNEETEHNLEYYCVDALGNTGPVDEEKFKVEGTSFNITINKKWNLISVPFVMLNDSIDEVFKDIADDIISVWAYDGETGNWSVYTPDGNPDNDNLHEMKPGWGYWVLARNDTQLVIGGSLFSPAKTPPARVLVPGWNLIGYYGTDGILNYDGPDRNGSYAYCALYSLVNLDGIILTKWTSLLTYWEPYNPNQWVEYDRCDRLDPGAGYWIFMVEEGTYSYSTVCPAELWDILCGQP